MTLAEHLPLQNNRPRQQTSFQSSFHSRIKNPALSHNTGKMYIPEFFNYLLGAKSESDD